MTTWKDGGDSGRIYREIVNENDCVIAKVRTRHSASYRPVTNPVIPWPEGKANFRLILKAPQMMAALCSIRDQAECFLQPLASPSVSRARWEAVRNRAVAAITATKGEGNDSIG